MRGENLVAIQKTTIQYNYTTIPFVFLNIATVASSILRWALTISGGVSASHWFRLKSWYISINKATCETMHIEGGVQTDGGIRTGLGDFEEMQRLVANVFNVVSIRRLSRRNINQMDMDDKVIACSHRNVANISGAIVECSGIAIGSVDGHSGLTSAGVWIQSEI